MRRRIAASTNANGMSFRPFSALSQDGLRLYIPIDEGQLLRITASDIGNVPNGNNAGRLWIEHPYGQALRYKPNLTCDGLAQFERLIVETQACRTPAMGWLVAMHEGFFPFVRDICRARFLLVHIGGTQQGKTTGAQRFTLLHGLGEVKGDFSVAALADSKDIGLLVTDNREQANFTQALNRRLPSLTSQRKESK